MFMLFRRAKTSCCWCGRMAAQATGSCIRRRANRTAIKQGFACSKTDGRRISSKCGGLFFILSYSTVTDLARLRGWSTSQPRRTAM